MVNVRISRVPSSGIRVFRPPDRLMVIGYEKENEKVEVKEYYFIYDNNIVSKKIPS